MFAFQFIADAIGVTRDGLQLPPTIKVKPVAGARQSTPQLAANDAKLIWLRTQLRQWMACWRW